MNSKVLLTAWVLAAAALAAPSLAAAQTQAAAAANASSFDELISLQTASDRMNMELDQVVRASIARGVAERKSMSASKPIENYLKEIEKENLASVPPAAANESPGQASTPQYQPMSADDIPPLVERELELWEKRMAEVAAEVAAVDDAARREVDAYAAAKAKGVAIKVLTAKSIETWGRLVVIVPPGEVIENDPMDVAHAKLEDLTRRRDELQAELKTKPNSMGMRSILRELAGIDRQINSVMFQITGVVWFHRAGGTSICHPPAVKGRPVAWHNCDYWALNTPFVVDPSGENIIVDRVRIDVDESASGLRSARIAYYTRAKGQAPSDEPRGGASGDFRRMADGTVQLIVKEVDEAGEERERAYPIELATDGGQGLLPGFGDHGPFKLKFKRDPKAYISFEEAQAALSEIVPLVGPGSTPPAPPSHWAAPDEDGLVPLVGPGSTPSTPPSHWAAPDEDGLVPLVGPGSTPPAPPSQWATPDADGLVPLVGPGATPPASPK